VDNNKLVEVAQKDNNKLVEVAVHNISVEIRLPQKQNLPRMEENN
jgi:hypothetical protein